MSNHFKHVIEILSSWLNIVKSCQEITFGDIKWSNEVTETWKWVGWQIVGLGIQLWHSFYNFSTSSLIIHILMTCCHYGIKRGHKTWKLVGWLILGWRFLLWHSFFKFTKSSLIIHIMKICFHFGITRGLPRAVANISVAPPQCYDVPL